MDLTLRLKGEHGYRIDEVFYSGDKSCAVIVDVQHRRLAFVKQKELEPEERENVVVKVRKILEDDSFYRSLGWFKRAEYANQIEEKEMAKASAVVMEYAFSDVLGVEYVEDGRTIGRSLREGQQNVVIAPGTGGTNDPIRYNGGQLIHNVMVYVAVRGKADGGFWLDFLGAETDKGKKVYSDASEAAKRFYSTVDIIVNQREVLEEVKVNSGGSFISIADELQKLADLHGSGILTRQEFEDLKARVLAKL